MASAGAGTVDIRLGLGSTRLERDKFNTGKDMCPTEPFQKFQKIGSKYPIVLPGIATR